MSLSRRFLFLIIYTKLHLIFNFNLLFLLYKTNLNENIFHLLSVIWTNSFFLFGLLFFLWIIWQLFQFFNFKIIFCIFAIYLIYCQESFNFIATIDYLANENILQTFINSFLTNNLNKYHPYLFYFNLSCCLKFFVYFFYKLKLIKVFNKEIFIFFSKRLVYQLITLNLLILFLGSWWAFQEGTWGGWWNWDASELFGFFFLIFLIFIIHTKQIYFFVLLFFFINNFFFISILLVYFFIQLNFELSSHNFGGNFFYFFNNNFFYFLVLSFLMLNFIRYYKKIRLYLNFNHLKLFCINQFSFFLISAVINLLAIYIIFSNFSILINYFFWFYAKINFLNLNLNYSSCIFNLFLLSFILFFLTITKFQNILFLLLNNFLIVLILNLKIIFNFTFIGHLLLLLFVIANLYYRHTWFIFVKYTDPRLWFDFYITLNWSYIEKGNVFVTFNNFITNFCSLHFSNLNLFSKLDNSFVSLLNFNNISNKISIFIEDPSVCCLLILIIFFFFFWKRINFRFTNVVSATL